MKTTAKPKVGPESPGLPKPLVLEKCRFNIEEHLETLGVIVGIEIEKSELLTTANKLDAQYETATKMGNDDEAKRIGTIYNDLADKVDALIAKKKALYNSLCQKINSIHIADDGFGFKNHWWFYRSGTKEVMYED